MSRPASFRASLFFNSTLESPAGYSFSLVKSSFGLRTHLVEPIDGNETENYWFAVKDEDKEGSEL